MLVVSEIMETENSVSSSDNLVNDDISINAHGIHEDEAIGASSLQTPQITKSQSDDVIQSSPSKPFVNGFIDKSNSCDIERKLNETQNSLINSHESNIGYADDDDGSDNDEQLGACYSSLPVDKGALETHKEKNDTNGKCACVSNQTKIQN